eukprot:Unigene14094_Nuclearia_a/m.42540 Unigene14094_Nuclearia_a/g.42540  ORF Unigene14094_Nuclearia_a/g.42540 Unigene14094_Nuclearia_a/m.42540 type:complete len:145 (+) Unigene14094_Nuclearia_a:287-721(+)
MVSQLLLELDDLEHAGDDVFVFLLGATNAPERIDEAFMRPGRLDTRLFVGPPEEGERTDILRIHAARMRLAADVDLAGVAARTTGFTGADLYALCQRAAMAAVDRLADAPGVEAVVTGADFAAAVRDSEPSVRPGELLRYLAYT